MDTVLPGYVGNILDCFSADYDNGILTAKIAAVVEVLNIMFGEGEESSKELMEYWRLRGDFLSVVLVDKQKQTPSNLPEAEELKLVCKCGADIPDHDLVRRLVGYVGWLEGRIEFLNAKKSKESDSQLKSVIMTRMNKHTSLPLLRLSYDIAGQYKQFNKHQIAMALFDLCMEGFVTLVIDPWSLSNEVKNADVQLAQEIKELRQRLVTTELERDDARASLGLEYERGFREGETKQAILEVQGRERFLSDLREAQGETHKEISNLKAKIRKMEDGR